MGNRRGMSGTEAGGQGEEGGQAVERAKERSLMQLQIDRKAQALFTEYLASAGVAYTRIAQEVLFYLPRDFVDAYEEVWRRACAGKDDGGSGLRGSSDAEQALVGKASGKGLQGLGGAKRKGYKKYWVIADDAALDIKERTDKKLRSLARTMREELAVGKKAESGELLGCQACGRILQVGWKFCPNDGEEIKR